MLIHVTRLEYFTKLQYMVHKEEDRNYIKWFDSANNLVGMFNYPSAKANGIVSSNATK